MELNFAVIARVVVFLEAVSKTRDAVSAGGYTRAACFGDLPSPSPPPAVGKVLWISRTHSGRSWSP